ncbi:MAG: hypothetical protein ABDH21_00380 [bacterium]
MYIFKILCVAVIMLYLLTSIAFSNESKLVGVIYKQVDNHYYGKVYTKLNPGDILEVYRSNQKIGKVKIEQIDENYNVLVSVLEGQISTGDSLFLINSGSSTTNTTQTNPNYSTSLQQQSSSVGLPYDRLNDGLRYYSEVLSNNTKIIKFGPNSTRPTKVIIDPLQLTILYTEYEGYRTLSEIAGSSGVMSGISTFYLLNLLGNLWNMYQNIKGPQINNPNVPDSFIQIVLLDEKLAKARTILHGYKEAIYDKNYLENYYRNLVNSTNIDDFYIFEVTIFNAYNQPLPLQPFAYKIYLIGQDNRRYKAIKYDVSLDSTLAPGGKTTGFVYFAKYDIASDKTINRIRLSIEEIGPIKQEIVDFK